MRRLHGIGWADDWTEDGGQNSVQRGVYTRQTFGSHIDWCRGNNHRNACDGVDKNGVKSQAYSKKEETMRKFCFYLILFIFSCSTAFAQAEKNDIAVLSVKLSEQEALLKELNDKNLGESEEAQFIRGKIYIAKTALEIVENFDAKYGKVVSYLAETYFDTLVLAQEFDELRSKNFELREEIWKKNLQLAELNATRANQIAELHLARKAAVSRQANTIEKLRNANLEVASLKRTIDELNKSIERQNKLLAEKDKLIDQQKRIIHELLSKRNSLDTKVAEQNKIITALKSELFNLRKSYDAAKRATNTSSQSNANKTLTESSLEKAFESQSRDVRMSIQALLRARGFYKSSIDGLWGKGTSSALIEFAKSSDMMKSTPFDVLKATYKGMSITYFEEGSGRRSGSGGGAKNSSNNSGSSRSTSKSRAEAICRNEAANAVNSYASSRPPTGFEADCSRVGRRNINCTGTFTQGGGGFAGGMLQGLQEANVRNSAYSACLARYGYSD